MVKNEILKIFFPDFKFQENKEFNMKVCAVFVLVVAFTAALPAPYPQSDAQSDLFSVDVNSQVENSDRSKRFILKKLALLKIGALGVG